MFVGKRGFTPKKVLGEGIFRHPRGFSGFTKEQEKGNAELPEGERAGPGGDALN